MINEEIANNEIDYHEKKPKHDYGCWFMNNNLIVPKLNEQYILKKDLSWGECNFPSGMIVKVAEYIPSKEYLKVKINTQSIPEDKFPLGIANGKLSFLRTVLVVLWLGNLIATVFNFAVTED